MSYDSIVEIAAMKFRLLIFLLGIGSLTSCMHKSSTEDEDNKSAAAVKTPVTIAQISRAVISDTLQFSATSAFLHKSVIRSAITGYIEDISLVGGDHVEAGQKIATIQTKEAQALQNIHTNDSLLNFKGTTLITSNLSGVVTNVMHQTGDYVQEGDALCEVAAQKSLIFMLNVPASKSSFIKPAQACWLLLPDHRRYPAKIQRMMPIANASSQSLQYLVGANINTTIPESLQVKILIPNTSQNAVPVLPKPCVLTNETETTFWVMKLINDTTAVRVNISIGMETADNLEILSPAFNASDRFLLNGNYGLGDTAYVQIEKQ
jgi:biotin carboxyl carrier protein